MFYSFHSVLLFSDSPVLLRLRVLGHQWKLWVECVKVSDCSALSHSIVTRAWDELSSSSLGRCLAKPTEPGPDFSSLSVSNSSSVRGPAFKKKKKSSLHMHSPCPLEISIYRSLNTLSVMRLLWSVWREQDERMNAASLLLAHHTALQVLDANAQPKRYDLSRCSSCVRNEH